VKLVPKPLRPHWRRLRNRVRKGPLFLAYKFGVWTGRRDPLVPPRGVHKVGDSDFLWTGDLFFGYFVDLCKLQPDERILDVGCGTGRIARPLLDYLHEPGEYEGLDVAPDAIKWCKKRISSRYPHFRFQLADIYNRMYNPSGRTIASEYRFPYDDESFDFVILASVFTHMLHRDLANYTAQIARVLRPGGTLFGYLFFAQSRNPAAPRLGPSED